MCVRDRLLFQDEPWNFLMQNWIKTWIPSRRLLGFAGGLGSIDLIQVQSETWALCPLQLRTLRIWGDLLLFLTPLLKPSPLFPGCVFLFLKKKTTQKLITTKLLDSSNFNIDILVSFIVRWLWKQGQWKIDASFLPRGRTPTTFALSLCASFCWTWYVYRSAAQDKEASSGSALSEFAPSVRKSWKLQGRVGLHAVISMEYVCLN